VHVGGTHLLGLNQVLDLNFPREKRHAALAAPLYALCRYQ
jgi:hypothetical protein